jgi:tetratricopeptide (TPR) repeat protein
MLGVACRDGGDVIRAIKILEDLLNSEPDYLPTLFHLASCYNQLEWYKMSTQVLSKAYRLHPDSPDLCAGLGVTSMKMGQEKQAEEYFLKAMSMDDKSPLVLNNTGVFYMERDKFKEASRLFLRALNGDKRNPGIAYNLALTYYKMGQLKWAKEYLALVLESSPHHLAARHLLVEIYKDLGEPQNAMSTLAEIISLDNNDYGDKVAYAQLLLKIGENEQGIAVMEEVVKNNPGNIEYLSLLTGAYRLLGWYDIAILKLSKFLDKNEKSAALLSLLGETYLGKAMSAAKGRPDFCSKAIYYLKEAHSLAESEPQTLFWYARALWDCQNDVESARPLFQKCLSLGLDPELKKEAEAYLKRK